MRFATKGKWYCIDFLKSNFICLFLVVLGLPCCPGLSLVLANGPLCYVAFMLLSVSSGGAQASVAVVCGSVAVASGL